MSQTTHGKLILPLLPEAPSKISCPLPHLWFPRALLSLCFAWSLLASLVPFASLSLFSGFCLSSLGISADLEDPWWL